MDFEFDILDAISKLHTPILNVLMKLFTTLGDAGLVWIILAIVLMILPKTRKYGLVMALALLIDVILCNGILKNLIARERPFNVRENVELLIKKPNEYSFPSGHTAASFSAFFALLFSKEKRWHKLVLVLACIIAFSRLYFYVHFPTDILGGVLIGFVSGLGAYIICTRIFKLDFLSSNDIKTEK